jgi:hypothetical protein
MSWGPGYLPERPSGYVGFQDFTVLPGRPRVVPLDGDTPADAGDTGATWNVWIGVPNANRAIGHEGNLSSPPGARTSNPSTPSRYARVTPWTCSRRPATGFGLTGTVRLCVRQVRGVVRTTGSITYTAKQSVDVQIGTAFDGVLGAAQTTVALPASPTARRTVALPSQASQVLRRDRQAVAYLRVATTPVRSAPLRLR